VPYGAGAPEHDRCVPAHVGGAAFATVDSLPCRCHLQLVGHDASRDSNRRHGFVLSLQRAPLHQAFKLGFGRIHRDEQPQKPIER